MLSRRPWDRERRRERHTYDLDEQLTKWPLLRHTLKQAPARDGVQMLINERNNNDNIIQHLYLSLNLAVYEWGQCDNIAHETMKRYFEMQVFLL